ncbi:phage tail tape measure protein [Nocardiaceae bacterium NPDC056970]
MRTDLATAGAEAGQATAGALQESFRKIEQASGKVAEARQGEVSAAAAVREAERQLAAARDAASADAEAIAAAESELEGARRRASNASAAAVTAARELATAQRGLAAESKEVAAASNALRTAQEREEAAAGKLRIAQAKLDELRASGRASAAQLAAAEDKLETAQRNVRNAADRTATAMLDLDAAQDRAVNGAREATPAFESQGTSLAELGRQAASAGAAFAGLGGLAATAFSAMDQEKSIDRLNASLGANGGYAKENAEAVKAAFGNGFGSSIDEVATAVEALQSNIYTLGFEGEQSLQSATEKALAFSDVFGTDLAESTQTAGQLITNGLAKDSTEAFDLMTTAMQRVPLAMRDELPEIINEYGTHFRGLGFSGEESFNLLVDAASRGKWALDKTGDALKEFTLRGSDMSKTSVEAYEAIKLNATDMSNAIAAGGPAAQDALQQTARGLLAIEDPAERANTAIALFGTPVEDLAVDQIPSFLEALGGAPDAMAGFEGSTQAAADTLRDNAGTELETFKRGLTQTFVDVMGGQVIPKVEAFAGWLRDNKPLLTDLGIAVTVLAGTYGVLAARQAIVTAGGFVAWIRTAITSTGLWTAAQTALNLVMSLNPFVAIGLLIAAFVGAIVLAYRNSETFRNIVQAAWEGIQAAASAAWNGFLKPILDALVGAFLWVGEKAMWLWNEGIVPAFNGIVDAAGSAKDWIVEKFTALVDFVTGLPGRIKSAASGMWDGIKDAFKSALNWVINKWNSLSFTLPSIEAFGHKIGGGTFSVPQIPTFAQGGKITGPGTGTSDSILAAVSNGEFVVNARATAAFLPLLEALNSGRLPAFASGGLVEAQRFAQGESGKPYQYGGVGNPSWDCSGFMSGIYATLTGKDPFTRYFTTESDFEALGFLPGLGGPGDFSIGVSRGGGGPYSHMAGTLGDLDVESGSNGVIAGSGAQGAADFPLKWHLPGLGDDPNATTLSFSDSGASNAGGASGSYGSYFGKGGSAGGSGAAGSAGGNSGMDVFVVNWPSGATGAAAGTADMAGTDAGESAAGEAAEVYSPGSWWDDPEGELVNAAFEVLGIDKTADDVLPEQVGTGWGSRFGVRSASAAAPVVPDGSTPGGSPEGAPVVGTQVNGDVYLTDLDEFNRRNEQGMRDVAARLGL